MSANELDFIVTLKEKSEGIRVRRCRAQVLLFRRDPSVRGHGAMVVVQARLRGDNPLRSVRGVGERYRTIGSPSDHRLLRGAAGNRSPARTPANPVSDAPAPHCARAAYSDSP